MRRIGIMGGTFNPIHVGHLMLAEWAADEFELDEVWFIPAGSPYMKDPGEVLPGRERLHMTELAVRDNAAFRCLDVEVVREGSTYSFETLTRLKAEYPGTNFFFIVGADCLFAMESWKNPEKIFENCTLIAAVRGEAGLEEMKSVKECLERKFSGEILLLPFVSMSVSSTEIRRRIREGKSVRYLIPAGVAAYIEEKGFYREKRK